MAPLAREDACLALEDGDLVGIAISLCMAGRGLEGGRACKLLRGLRKNFRIGRERLKWHGKLGLPHGTMPLCK